VPDSAQAVDRIGALAVQMDGFVVTSQSSKVKDQPTYASITIRVPVERLDEALKQIEALGSEVRNRTINGQDVTEEYTDLQSRLRNLEAAETQLQAIMERAGKIEEVLNVHRQLVETRNEIEQIKGRIEYLEQSAAMSSITVELMPDALAQPIATSGWQASATARTAAETLVRSLQFLADIAIWVAIYVLPILLVLAIPAAIVYLALRRARRAGPKPARS
jgi:archaellum component FlaC